MYGEWVRSSIAANKPYDQMARERHRARLRRTVAALPSLRRDQTPGETMAEEVRVSSAAASVRAVPQSSVRIVEPGSILR
jgi:hypothetical protein